MLRKLLKYDLMFSKTQFLVMAAGMVFVSILIRVFDILDFFGPVFSSLMILLPLAITIIVIICIVLVYQNYYRNIFSGEGYLRLTLPVTRNSIILSKLLVSLIWFNIMLFASVLSVFILIYNGSALEISFGSIMQLVFSLILMNLIAINSILFLFTLSTTANVSIRGKRLGYFISALFSGGVFALEILFGSKILNPLFGGSGIAYISGEGFNKLQIIRSYSDIDMRNVINMSIIPFFLLITVIVFSVLLYVFNLHCLKKRIDLQ